MKNLIKVITILLFIISCTPEQQRYFVNDSPNATYTPIRGCTLEEQRLSYEEYKRRKIACSSTSKNRLIIENEDPDIVRWKKECKYPLNNSIYSRGGLESNRMCVIRKKRERARSKK